MSTYEIEAFPNKDYRFEFFINYGKETFRQIKARTGCYGIVNLGYYDMAKYSAARTRQEVLDSTDCGFILDGVEIGKLQYNDYGVCISSSGELFIATPQGQKNYCIGLPPQYIDGKKYPTNAFVARNGCTHIGFKADGTPVVLIASKDDGMTSDEANAAMIGKGCVNILRYDGSWSSQGDLGGGKVIAPSQQRIVQSYLLVFERKEKEEKPMKKYKICIDPGHGLGESANGSPDGTYKEHEFTLDLGKRIRAHLLRCGIDVLMTREDGTTPTLTARAQKANTWGADLFVSIHSNAVGNSGWDDKVCGLTVWTYDPGGERDRAAKLLLAEMKSAGVQTFGTELYHSHFTVLAKSNMPAYLVEYAFHTAREDVKLLKSTEHRDKLAYATAKAICAWCGVQYVPEEEPEGGSVYRVQVGAFTQRVNAETLKAELEGKGYAPFIVGN